ncbi:T-cell surface glycoprotein CD3 zeta chain [Odontesthes bonariensis]|uniref:T-cell surface glycoprotein CD3 zeta chain n=1 Tax=Odontesthes bonariensis TaxID=219752 RepID=UPI003F580C23
MELQMWVSGLLVLASTLPSAEALHMYDPQLCYILDGFLGLYGLIITGMFIKEKFFKTKAAVMEENPYSDLRGQGASTYDELMTDSGRGKARSRPPVDETYTGLHKRPDGEYKELPIKSGNRGRRNHDAVYQGLSPASRDTYDSLHMQQLSAR